MVACIVQISTGNNSGVARPLVHFVGRSTYSCRSQSRKTWANPAQVFVRPPSSFQRFKWGSKNVFMQLFVISLPRAFLWAIAQNQHFGEFAPPPFCKGSEGGSTVCSCIYSWSAYQGLSFELCFGFLANLQTSPFGGGGFDHLFKESEGIPKFFHAFIRHQPAKGFRLSYVSAF